MSSDDEILATETVPQNSGELQILRTARGIPKGQLTRLKTMLSGNKLHVMNTFELQTKLELLERHFDSFNQSQAKIETLNPSEVDERERFEDSYCQIKAKILEAMNAKVDRQSLSVLNSTNPLSNTAPVQHLDLPRHKLKTFSGDPSEWIEWWNLYSMMVEEKVADPRDKFHRLRSMLEGAALESIRSLELTAENYSRAIEILKDQYNNTRYLYQVHINKILEINKFTIASVDNLTTLNNIVNSNMRALLSLAEKEKVADGILLALVTSKLDSATKNLWEEHVTAMSELSSTSSNTNDLPSWEEFSKFLQKRCRTISIIEFNKNHEYREKHQASKSKQRYSKAFVASQDSGIKCILCADQCKYIASCPRFLEISPSERIQRVKQNLLCINCLKPGHNSKNCKSSNCKFCTKRHHTLLHLGPVNPTATSTSALGNQFSSTYNNDSKTFVISDASQVKPSPISSKDNSCIVSRTPNKVILSTALIQIKSANNTFVTVRALLDSASQSNFITRHLVQLLSLKRVSTSTRISGVGKIVTQASHQTSITIKSRLNNFEAEIDALIVPSITGHLPTESIDVRHIRIPSNITLADPSYHLSQRIDVLIGASLFFTLLSRGQIRVGNTTAGILQKTIFGWIVAGDVSNQLTSTSLHSMQHENIQEPSNDSLNKSVNKFWELENHKPEVTPLSDEERTCENHFKETHCRLASGKFEVRLPFKKSPSLLGDSFQTARKRFFNLESKLLKNPNLKLEYAKFMQEYLELGHMELFSEDESTKDHFFLPHHSVIKCDSTSTKLRVVFDGSAKSTTGVSVNDLLMVGANVQDDLFSILIRFRLHKYAITADIVKMYRQINVHKDDRKFQCIVWRDSTNSPLRKYKLATVTYGTTSAAFLAIRSLKQLALDEEKNFPTGSNHVLKNFYVDNLMSGANTLEELLLIRKEVSEMLMGGSFPLRKWCSNHEDALEGLPHDHRESFMYIDDENFVKALGMYWNPAVDNFAYHRSLIVDSSKPITKRIVLSELSQFFDPLGLINPIFVKAKLFIQHLWSLKLAWDESLPQELEHQWETFRSDLYCLREITVPRCTTLPESKFQIHGFCDASMNAYGACIYLRCKDRKGTIKTTLMCAKSRVAPIRTESLARLELCAALLLSELLERTVKLTSLHLERITLWSDSTITLNWIDTDANKWSTFVANRVAKIQTLVERTCWRHVPTALNPADLISRGCTPKQMATSSAWFNGPSFLSLDESCWPKHPTSRQDELPERKSTKFTFVAVNDNYNDLSINSKFINSYFKLVSAFCYILRWLPKNKVNRSKKISPDEFSEASTAIAKNLQRTYLNKEFNRLSSGNFLLQPSRFLKLNPFIDSSGTIRVGGRLRNANISYESKHQILIPKDHPFTEAIINHIHIENLHAGPHAVLNSLRLRFWIIDGIRSVTKVLRKCIVCFRFRPKLAEQIMGDLPFERLHNSKPFTFTGVDYCGPVYLTERIRGRGPIKAFIAIFICFSVKAVHIELVPDLSTAAFLAALRRFISRRGNCAKLYSDNGTNFVGARNELREICKNIYDTEAWNEVQQFCLTKGISWHFIPPRSPHFGGLWEAAVKIAKGHLKRVMASLSIFTFTYDEMNTLLCQIEAIMNSRPICPMSSDPNDLEALTPSHFLTGGPSPGIPDFFSSSNISRLNHYQRIQHMRLSFWRRWQRDYLQLLQSRNKWNTPSPRPLKEGVLVIIQDESLPPLRWQMGRVESLHPGQDGHVRVVSIRTKSGTIKRAIHKIAVLPIDSC